MESIKLVFTECLKLVTLRVGDRTIVLGVTERGTTYRYGSMWRKVNPDFHLFYLQAMMSGR
jgi:hypothetical protein